MIEFEPRIYSVEIALAPPGDYVDQFCRDLGVTPEYLPRIEEDAWHRVNSLAIWFQAIEPHQWTVHIQKIHFRHNTSYLKDLKNFAKKVESLHYVREAGFRRM